MIIHENDTIAAPATATGGALCVIRVSGPQAIEVCDAIFRGRTTLAAAPAASARYGEIVGKDGSRIDDAVVTVFRAPHSYTGEDSVEISLHGSSYVVQATMQALTGAGARPAEAGEFTRRAFLAGRMDLAQAEAVADMIASTSRAAHAVASTQMRGDYSQELQLLRQELLQITSLLELELDFSEEDVEFADRSRLDTLLRQTRDKVSALAGSFALGNALKEGVAVAIVGRPNVGKSTLLNRLAGEQRAMVSDIAGTTRDTVEARINIDGVTYRFIDTAGVHATTDTLELMGIDRTRQALEKARIVLWLTTAEESLTDRYNLTKEAGPSEGMNSSGREGYSATGDTSERGNLSEVADLRRKFASATGITLAEDQILYRIINKIDLQTHEASDAEGSEISEDSGVSDGSATSESSEGSEVSGISDTAGHNTGEHTIRMSAKTGEGVSALVAALGRTVDATAAYRGEAIVTNQRHYHALREAQQALETALDGLRDGLTSDLLSEDIRLAITHLGEITGEITSADILQNIFSKFCIGK